MENYGNVGGAVLDRNVALATLEKMCKKAGTQKKFEQALQEYTEQNPLECFSKFVMPFLVKEVKEEGFETQ